MADKTKKSWLKIGLIVLAAIAGLMICALVVVFFARDYIFNQYIKDKLLKSFAESQPGYVMRLSDLRYNVSKNSIECDSASLTMRDATKKTRYEIRVGGMEYAIWGNQMICDSVSLTSNDSSIAGSIDRVILNGVSRYTLLGGQGFTTDLFAKTEIGLSGIVLSEPRTSTELRCASMMISVADSAITAVQLTESDSLRSCTLGSAALRGINWKQFLGGNTHFPAVCATSVLDAKAITILYPGSQYEFRSSGLFVSIPDSIIRVDSVTIEPVNGDDEFFADSKFRKTRLRFNASSSVISGADVCGVLQATGYSAHRVVIQDGVVEILVNKEKPENKHDSLPRMPGVILADRREPVRFDSVHLMNGTIVYEERNTVTPKPSHMLFDNLDVNITGFGNGRRPVDTAVVDMQGRLQKAGNVNIRLTVPLLPAGFYIHAKGTVSKMELSAFNSWVEQEDAMRISTGTMREGTFDLSVAGVKARGQVSAAFENLYVALIDAKTKSEFGFFNQLKSFIANRFKLRTDNMPDKNGKMKIGIVKYSRRPDDPFFKVLWFSLRSGLKDLVGF